MLEIELYRDLISPQNDWKNDRTFLPLEISRWLCSADSMTEKLRRLCPELAISVINEQWCEEVWVREVLLQGDTQNWLFARTEIPKPLTEMADSLLQLGQQPIGPWLFAQNAIRNKIEWRQDQQTGLYMRRSDFLLHNQKLRISELFLDAFPFSDK